MVIVRMIGTMMTMLGRLPGPWSPGARRGWMRWRGTGRQGGRQEDDGGGDDYDDIMVVMIIILIS